ncbi:MAG: malectin domain-containing carbohydrate-binding protein [Bacteroidales bacterium]|nr:malectin domain-containing carbohydrate-binding protein [Bacteroidales bacterium]
MMKHKYLLKNLIAVPLLLFGLNLHGQNSPEPVILSSGWQLQEISKVPQTGDVISQTGYQPKDWYAATVPGTVLTTLVNNHVYPEPLYGENNRPDKIPETLCRTSYWYRTTVTVPAGYSGKTIWLNFDGINYLAYVWVNGKKTGPIKGAFIRGRFDISNMVEPGKEAVVAVCISPQPNPGIPAEHTVGAGNGPIGGISRIDGPTFACSIGWDWMPGIRDRNTGIWQKVFLSATGPVVLKDPRVTTDLPLPRTDIAFVEVQATLRNTTAQPQKGLLKGRIGNIAFEKPVELAAWTAQSVTFDAKNFPQLRMVNPKLWWPNGLGEPNLYSLQLSFEVDGKTSDAQNVSFGIREITYDVPETRNLALSVNGVRVYCKGGNWGMDEAMKRIPRERLEAQVRLHQLANFNMIRNWGGQSTSEDLYDLCDKYGILLWDEFFQFNTADPLDLDLYMANVRDKTLRFRNHPCIAVWCGRNEAYPPKYLDDAVRDVLKDLDPSRWYQSNSGGGRGANSGGPYDLQTPIDYYLFSEKKNFNKDESFKTEIGGISIPTLESVQGMMPEKDWNTINDDWAEHDFMAGSGRKYPQLVTNRYGKIANLADFVRKGQMMNYESYRAMYEGRQAQMFKPVQGILAWMSHPAQPSFVWQIYHYDLEPNAALFAVKKACEQVHIQFNEKGNGTIQVINNLPTALSGAKARIILYNLDGSSPYQQEFNVTAAPSAVTALGAVAWPATLSPVHFVKLELRDAGGKLLSDNFYWRGLSSKPDDLTALNTMPVQTLEAKVVRRDLNGKCFLEVTFGNPGSRIALMTHLQLRRGTSRERVLPVYYSDNYFSLAPKEVKTITIEAALSDLKGEKPLVLIDGWNIAVKRVSSKIADVALNAEAQVGHWPETGLSFVEPKVEQEEEVHLNCGGFTRDGFRGDPGYLAGTPGFSTDKVEANIPLAAPEPIYQTVRWGACSYPFALKPHPGKTYTVRLHFAELNEKAQGKRVFDVSINGKKVLTDLDIFKETDGKNKALVKQFSGIAPDADGRIAIGVEKGKIGTPQINGIEILIEK